MPDCPMRYHAAEEEKRRSRSLEKEVALEVALVEEVVDRSS